MKRRRMTPSEWTALASETTVRGVVHLFSAPPDYLFREEAIAAVQRLDPADIVNGSHRVIVVAAQRLLPGPADLDDIVRELGTDALIWRFRPGGARAHLEELRDGWCVPSFGALVWACQELHRQAQLRHIDRLTRSARCGEDVTRLLGTIVSMGAG